MPSMRGSGMPRKRAYMVKTSLAVRRSMSASNWQSQIERMCSVTRRIDSCPALVMLVDIVVVIVIVVVAVLIVGTHSKQSHCPCWPLEWQTISFLSHELMTVFGDTNSLPIDNVRHQITGDETSASSTRVALRNAWLILQLAKQVRTAPKVQAVSSVQLGN